MLYYCTCSILNNIIMINSNVMHVFHLLRKTSICDLNKSQKSAILRIAKTLRSEIESDLSDEQIKLNPMELIVEISDKRIMKNKSWTDHIRMKNGRNVLSNFSKRETLEKSIAKCKFSDEIRKSIETDLNSLYK